MHRDHSISCTNVAVLHIPLLPPFGGHVSLTDVIENIAARVEAVQAFHGDLFQRVYALLGMIERTFVRVPLDIVRQNVLSLRWKAIMLSEMRCGTKIYHLQLVNMIRELQQTTRHHLPVCVDMNIHY